MANFGFRHLAVVAPYEEHWREAKSAVGAPDVLANARETATVAEAVSDCSFVMGTASLARRNPDQRVVSLPEVAPIILRQLERGGKLALVFGSEKRGLTADDLARCHLLVEIPTGSAQPSMNLGQAVAVCLYEIGARGQDSQTASRQAGQRTVEPPPTDPPATGSELDRLAGVVDQTLIAANYSPSIMGEANRRDVQLLLRRLALTGSDARRVMGVFRRILWRLHRHESGNGDPPPIPHK